MLSHSAFLIPIASPYDSFLSSPSPSSSSLSASAASFFSKCNSNIQFYVHTPKLKSTSKRQVANPPNIITITMNEERPASRRSKDNGKFTELTVEKNSEPRDVDDLDDEDEGFHNLHREQQQQQQPYASALQRAMADPQFAMRPYRKKWDSEPLPPQQKLDVDKIAERRTPWYGPPAVPNPSDINWNRRLGVPIGMTPHYKSFMENGFDFSGGQSGRYWLKVIRQMSGKDNIMVFRNITSLLSHSDIYYEAFEMIKLRMGAGGDPRRKLAVPSFNVDDLIQDLMTGQFAFKAIPKAGEEGPQPLPEPKHGKRRKVAWAASTEQVDRVELHTRRLPTRDDVMQEVLYMVLSAVFEPAFEETSHGYRTDRNPHTALYNVRRIRSVEWFLKGNLKDQFKQMDLKILRKFIEKRIDDDYFVDIVVDAVKANGISMKSIITTLIDVPTASPIARILTNIYFDQLDKFMRDYSRIFKFRPSKYLSAEELDFFEELPTIDQITQRDDGDDENESDLDDNSLPLPKQPPQKDAVSSALDLSLAEKSNIERQYIELHGPKQVNYVRYANIFLIAVNGSKSDAQEVENTVKAFMQNDLGLTDLDNIIVRANARRSFIDFLGARFYMKLRADARYSLKCAAPSEFIFTKLNVMGFCTRSGEPYPNAKWHHKDREQIVGYYNYTMVLLMNYYQFTDNFPRYANRLRWVMQHSCARLLAKKHKLKTRAKVFKKWGLDFDVPGVELAKLRHRERYTFMDPKFFKRETPWFL